MTVACVCLAFLCLVMFVVRADNPGQTSPAPSRTGQTLNIKSITSPVAVPEPSAKALSHYRNNIINLGLWILWNLFLLTFILITGLSARMRTWAQRLGRNRYFTFVLYGLALGLLYYLASLPLSFYTGYIHPHSYGLSNQTIGRWLGNYLKNAAVMIGIGLAVGWVPFLLIRKSPRHWWFYLALLTMPFICFMVMIQPVVIDPLFHVFQPLQNKTLEARILAQARRAGIEGSRVYEVDMSKDTKTMNAYVNGFMGTKRIVFWDTTLRTLDEDELLFVLGHEMGHYVLGHLVKIIIFISVLYLLLYLAVHLLAGRLISLFKSRFGFHDISDIAAMPLGILLALAITLAGMPVPMAFSRYLEHEADRFGLELTHNNHAAATSFVKFQQIGLGNPHPGTLVKIWLFTHPSIAERIDFFNSYRPWESGQPSHYEKYIK